MSVINSVLIGPVQTLSQNVVYALPARSVYCLSSLALQVSTDSTSGFVAVAGVTTGPTLLSGAFVSCSGGNAVCTFKVV